MTQYRNFYVGEERGNWAHEECARQVSAAYQCTVRGETEGHPLVWDGLCIYCRDGRRAEPVYVYWGGLEPTGRARYIRGTGPPTFSDFWNNWEAADYWATIVAPRRWPAYAFQVKRQGDAYEVIGTLKVLEP